MEHRSHSLCSVYPDVSPSVVDPAHPFEAQGLRFLFLCCGANGVPGSLNLMLEVLGGTVVMFDVVNGESFDLAEDRIFERLLADVRSGSFNCAFIRCPHKTFDEYVDFKGMVTVLRGTTETQIYGLHNLPPLLKDVVRTGTLLAVRCAVVDS